MSVGTLPEYGQFNLKIFDPAIENWDINMQEIIFNDKKLMQGRFFLFCLPLYNDNECVGAIVTLYTKDVAIANAKQVIMTLCIISFLCIILVIPFIFVLHVFSCSFRHLY